MFRSRGRQSWNRIGVISDTFPSLDLSMKYLGISDYFQSVVASSLVGAGKPDPRIYKYALNTLNVSAKNSIFIDDTKIEADGARKMGFTSFFIDRNGGVGSEWTISSLQEVVEYYNMAI